MTQRRALCLLLAACMVCGAIIFAELDSARHPEGAPTNVAEGPGLASMPRQHRPQLDELVTTILARPLFDQTRRAPQPLGSDASTDSALTDARLTGIVTEPSQRLAIFALTSARPLALTEGQTVSGWQIDSITPEEVSLTGPSGTKILRPNADSAVALPATPAASAERSTSQPDPAAAPQLPSFPPIPATAAQPRPALWRPVLPAQRTRDQE
jgi:hypothetical protein